MTTYQKSNAVAGSTQEVIKVQYTAKTHSLGGGFSRSDEWPLRCQVLGSFSPGN